MLTNEQHEFLNSLLSRARMKVANSPRRFISNASNTQDIRSGAGPDERDPATLGGSIDKFIVNKGWDLQVATGRIQAQWEAIVGSTLAQHVHIETFDLSGKQPRMVLRADSTAWATQVRLMTASIAARIDEELGDGRNTEVTILGPTAPSWKHGLRSVPGRGPRDTYG